MLMGYSLQFSLITLKLHFKEENIIHFKEKYNSGNIRSLQSIHALLWYEFFGEWSKCGEKKLFWSHLKEYF